MSQAVSSQRNNLYGPGRTVGREIAKKLQQEDHVQQNFRKGVGIEQYDHSDAFQTVTAQSFREHASQLSRPSCTFSTRNATNIELGSDTTQLPRSSVLKSDFCTKPLTHCKQRVPSGLHVTNIPDMASRYMSSKTFGKSLYVSDFDGDSAYEQWSSLMAKEQKKVGRRQKTTLYQKDTHFELGNDPPNLQTEATSCYTDGQHPHKEVLSSHSDYVQDKSKSYVFRAEDLEEESGAAAKDRFLTMQRKDFATCPPAGVSTTTTVGYSHVLPSNRAPIQALSSLRRLLIDKNIQEFKNPRDPTVIDITKSFLKYDRDRSGSIEIDELKLICQQLGTPITDNDIEQLLKECDRNGDGKIDYVEFRKYLTMYSSESISQGDRLVSANTDTYSARPQQPAQKEEPELMGAQYQTSTHFHFGESTDNSSTTYNQDFYQNASSNGGPPAPVLPCSAKVMPEFPYVPICCSTNRLDYIKHDVLREGENRLNALIKNQEKHSRLAVQIGNLEENRSCLNKESTMTSSYVCPPSDARPSLPSNRAPHDYHHLESNRALPHPLKEQISSEYHDKHNTPVKSSDEYLSKRKEAICKRTSRTSDNKDAHFVLGYDSTIPLSEKMVEFSRHLPVDRDLLAAGISNLPTKGYSVIDHDCPPSPAGEPDSTPNHADDEPDSTLNHADGTGLQRLLQQRNFMKNVNPRDPLNVNLRKAFLQYDKDLSGTISREEVESVCRELKVGVSDEDLQDIMLRCDKNGKGQIDYHDFALCLSRQIPPGSTHQPISTTRKDFKHPKAQPMSKMQKLGIAQASKRYIPLQPTHFFHLDYDNNYLHSTTMKDFKKPEEQ